MNDKKLIRRALMGEKQAQEECTEREIILPCPFCGGEATVKEISGRYSVTCTKHCAGTRIFKSKRESIKAWNTRPAPPIGRCGECKYFYSCASETACTNPLGMYQTEITEIDYCSCFKPKKD